MPSKDPFAKPKPLPGPRDEPGGVDFVVDDVLGTEGDGGSKHGAVLISFIEAANQIDESTVFQLSVPPLKLPPSTLGGASEFNHRHIHLQSPPGELG